MSSLFNRRVQGFVNVYVLRYMYVAGTIDLFSFYLLMMQELERYWLYKLKKHKILTRIKKRSKCNNRLFTLKILKNNGSFCINTNTRYVSKYNIRYNYVSLLQVIKNN